MKKVVLALILMFAFSYHIRAQDNGRGTNITGGFAIPITDAPYQVSIQEAGKHNCGGSIINSRYVLTAAHCAYGKNLSQITIRAGFDNMNNPGDHLQTFSVLNAEIHPEFRSGAFDFDIAVFEINGAFTFNQYVQPIELITDHTLSAEDVGKQVRASGWGVTIGGGSSSVNQLQAVDVPIITNQRASEQFRNTGIDNPITTNMMATGTGADRTGTCLGDSGGPLVFRQSGQSDIQIGVSSWGRGDCRGGANSPSIYARLSNFTRWMNEKGFFARISGSNVLCSESSYIFSLQKAPDFTNVNWSASGNIQIIRSGNSNVEVRARNSYASRSGWVTATIENGVALTKNVWVGSPSHNNFHIQGDRQVRLYASKYLSVSEASGTTMYEWRIIDDYNNSCSRNGPFFGSWDKPVANITTSSTGVWINYGSCKGKFRIRCSAISACGLQNYSDLVVTVGAPCPATLALSPNPSAHGVITMKYAPKPCGPQSTARSIRTPLGMSFTVFDMSGNSLLKGKSETDTYTLDVSLLKKGIYMIHVITSENEYLQSTLILNK